MSALLFSGGATTGQTKLPADVDKIFGDEGEKYFSFTETEPSRLRDLGKILSIDRMEGRRVYAYANRLEFSRFLELGYRYRILPHPGDVGFDLNMKEVVDAREILEWDFYPTYEGYIDMMQQFAADYPGLCKVFSVGQSVDGRELLVAKISDNVNLNEPEPQFLYTSSMHGDELTGYVLMLRLIDYLLENYGTDDRITGLVDNIEIWINPLANPDGTYAGGNHTVNGARRYNANWVDINRNFPDPEAGPHPDGNSWQAETIAFMEMAEANHFVSSANFHGGAEVCNYPWDTWAHLTADNDWWMYSCGEYADTAQFYSPSGYMTLYPSGITNGYAWYEVKGGRQDYMNYFHQCREFTAEISDIKLLPPAQLPAHWEYNYRSLLNYMEQVTYGIRGTVRDSVTNWPLEAEVYVLNHEADSSWVYSALPGGNFHRLLHEGSYHLRVSSPGYITRLLGPVNVQNRVATVMNIKLVPEGVGGLEDNPISHGIRLFPNPASGEHINVALELPVLTAEVIDLSGRTLESLRVYDDHFSVEVSQLPEGIYVLRVITARGEGVRKFMISR